MVETSHSGVDIHGESSTDLLLNLQDGRHASTKPRSRLDYACKLDIDQVAESVRQTSIVCTLGKSWKTKEGVKRMMDAGMDILLINLSMTPKDICKDVIKAARELEQECDYTKVMAIAMDMTAAPVRTGIFEGGPSFEANLKEGSRIELTLDEQYKYKCTAEKIFINTKYFPNLIHCLRKGDRIFLDDGQVTLYVKDTGFDYINCMVEDGGTLGSYKRVTLPRDRLYQESVHANYLKDLAFASECGVDFVFTSFSENASMIEVARQHLPGTTKVFAKLETRESIKNLQELLRASDGLIIRRSDLAMQYTAEKIFKLQKYIVGHCNIAEKPVFIIEQLVESMVTKPRPTRAESSDVANAVLDGADGLILTMETSWGQYAQEAVQVVDHICREAERAIYHETFRSELKHARILRKTEHHDIRHVTGGSAVEAAASCGASAIFALTSTGASAMSIATSRPHCSVIAITTDVSVGRHCHPYRGLHPFVYTGERLDEWSEDVDNRINAAIEYARDTGLVHGGDRIVVVTSSIATSGTTNTMQIFTLEDEHSKMRFVGSSHELAETDRLEQMLRRTLGGAGQADVDGDRDTDLPSSGRFSQRLRRPRFSVMLSRGNSVFGGVEDIRVPL